MSKSYFIGMIRNIRRAATNKIGEINKKDLKKIGMLTAILVTMPIIVQAASSEDVAEVPRPLSQEQSQKLAVNIAQLTPTAPDKALEIKIDPIPQTQPEQPSEPAPPSAPEIEPPVIQSARRESRTVARRNRNVVSTRRPSARAVSTNKAVVGSSPEQCVPFAREQSGVQIRGYAGNIQPNTGEAQVGSVALFSGYGHAAVVTGVDGDSVTVKEANYIPGKITERTVPKSQLRGYVK